jgi:hypothetical protein
MRSSGSKYAGLKYSFLRAVPFVMARTVSGLSSRPSRVSTMETFSSGNRSIELGS